MPTFDCSACEGTGYIQADDDTTIICTRCEGTGVVFVDEDAGDVLGDATE